jgi:hypothetical protein
MINGGNKNASTFFQAYDLHLMTTQKKYSTIAAEFYREKLKRSLDSDSQIQKLISKFQGEPDAPHYELGRQPLMPSAERTCTPQIKPYSQLEYQQIFNEVLASQSGMTLLERYDDKITSLEVLNKQAVKQRD